MMAKYKIAFFTNDSSLFGANRSLLNMLSILKDSDIVPIVVTPYIGSLNGELDNRGIRTYVVPFNTDCAVKRMSVVGEIEFYLKKLKRDLINFRARLRLKRILKNERIHAIHSNSGVLSIGFQLSQILEVNHIWHLREFIDLDHNLTPFGGWDNYISKIQSSSSIISISESIAAHFRLNNHYHVIYNAVMPFSSILWDDSEKDQYLLVCASFTHNKGIDDAIRAFSCVSDKYPYLRLKIAGAQTSNTEYYGLLNNLIEELGLSDRIDMVGYVSDIRIIMHKALALLMCSKNEAMGRVTAEAMLSNCLVLGFDNAGTSELIKNGSTGFLYKSDEELVNLIESLLDGVLPTAEIRQEAMRHASSLFTEEAVKSKFLTVFNKIL